jgi:hypothetical protein
MAQLEHTMLLILFPSVVCKVNYIRLLVKVPEVVDATPTYSGVLHAVLIAPENFFFVCNFIFHGLVFLNN